MVEYSPKILASEEKATTIPLVRRHIHLDIEINFVG